MTSHMLHRDVLEKTSHEIAKLEGERELAEREIAVASAVEHARAEVKLGKVKSALTEAHRRLEAQVGEIVKDADDHIAQLKAKAKTAKGQATQQLRSTAEQLQQRRDTLATKLASLKHATAGHWSTAKAELDTSLEELRKLRESGASGGA